MVGMIQLSVRFIVHFEQAMFVVNEVEHGKTTDALSRQLKFTML